ncbi:MAG: hypothetical protein Q8K58_10905, partial [Acidimicrobiales bacterium]|nr:hypothetical protein [Acidimicrobiales bacterium]
MVPPKPTKPATRRSTTTAKADRSEPGPRSVALVPVPKPEESEGLADPRRSDVDEWGRSEHMREVARQIYGPLYRRWHRV